MPCEPTALETVATFVAEELHVTVEVTFSVALLFRVPVAVSCPVVPAWMPEAPEIAMDWSTAALTLSTAVPAFFVFGSVAVIVVAPAPTPVASPVLETLATVAADATTQSDS